MPPCQELTDFIRLASLEAVFTLGKWSRSSTAACKVMVTGANVRRSVFEVVVGV